MPRVAKSSKVISNGNSIEESPKEKIAGKSVRKEKKAKAVVEIVVADAAVVELKKGRKKKGADIAAEEVIAKKPVEKRGKKKTSDVEEKKKDEVEKAKTSRRKKADVGGSVNANGEEGGDTENGIVADVEIKASAKSVTKGRKKKETATTEIIEVAEPKKELHTEKPQKNKTVSKKTKTSAKADAKVAVKNERGKKRALDTEVEVEVETTEQPTPKKKTKNSETKVTEKSKPPKTTRKRAGEQPAATEAVVEVPIVADVEDQTQKLTSKRKPKEKKSPAVAVKTVTDSRRKRAVEASNDDSNIENDIGGSKDDIDDDDDVKPAKIVKKSKTTTVTNPTATKYNKDDFSFTSHADNKNEDGAVAYNLKISSWNVAGLRSWLKKDGLTFLDYEESDIFCLQEIKCTTDQLPESARIPGYHPYWLCLPGGYAGVAVYSKIMPIHVEYGIGNEEFDTAGRIITAEYEKFYLINVYVPNSGRKLVNLEARMRWEKLFQDYVKKLDALKPVVMCGDMNVSHMEIDLANPKSNTRNAGFTKEERDKMTELLALGYVDTFRHFYPQRTGAYTFWTYMGNARSRNVGWRLDYFLVSERFLKRVVDNCIRTQCLGSDHCPITLYLKV